MTPKRAKSLPRKTAPVKKTVASKKSKAAPPLGSFGKILLQKLKNAPPATPVSVLILDTLRLVPPDELKAALKKATPKERNFLFSTIPGNQIKSVISSFPTTVLAPPEPPPPPPSPTNGPPASILMTTYENVAYPPAQHDPNWAEKITGGKTIEDFPDTVFEWTSVYDQHLEKEGSLNNPMVGLTGWVVENRSDTGEPSPISGSDIWFVHPFGNDFEFYIVPDPKYEGLLAASNTGVDPDYQAANTSAHNMGLNAPKGVLGVETDQGLVPDSFKNLITDGTRIATFGRWIVDSGHNDFHTEIHAPLLMAVATPTPPPAGRRGASQMTQLQIMSRPYTVSQRFAEGNFIDHLLAEVAKVENTFLGVPAPLSSRVEAHPTVFTTPYEGRPYIKLLVQPPPRKHRGPVGGPPQRLMVSYHFTHRTGVAVQVFDAGNGTVGIIIVLGDLNPATLPPKHDKTVSWDQVKAYTEYAYIIDVLEIADILTGDIPAAIILNRGILTDTYDAPSASSPLDNQNVASSTPVNQLQPWAGLSEDDGAPDRLQPFPIYGWLNVWWEDDLIVVGNTSLAETTQKSSKKNQSTQQKQAKKK